MASSNVDAYDVEGFCAAHSISRALFYKLLKEGKGPRMMRVSRRPLITREAAAEWRERMERETEGEAA